MAKSPKSPKSSNGKKSSSAIGKFPVIGIGASAGGLEALEQFLGNVPENSGMAYVVIQHLDPTQKGMLPELLQRITKIKVLQVTDHLKIQPDCVYVIPPNKTMSILKGVLHLFEPLETRGLRLPIDAFLRSLADDRQDLSIGLILSGMGSDGSAGLRAIKEKNGIVMVQDPATAKFDSMPRNALDSVLPDIVAPPGELPLKLIGFLKHIPVIKQNQEIEIKDRSSLEKIIILLRTFSGNDFSLYKKNTVYRRIERRMSVHKMDTISNYVRFLQENPKEVEILFKELMIGVTNFFRDPLVWEKIKDPVFPNLIANLPAGAPLRAWIPGCSTGEEAYSMAITFKEALEKYNLHERVSLQIFATDLDNDAIETARKGIFASNIASDVSASRLNRFFTATDDGYRINPEIREMVVFAQHNVIMQPPFTKIDILSCRNLLIYLDSELQNKLIRLFYYSLNPEGILLLGSSETLGALSHLFAPLDTKLKIYRRSVTPVVPELLDFPPSFSRIRAPATEKAVADNPIQNVQTLTDQLLLKHFSPAGVLVNEKGDILYIVGHTGKYLEPAVGKANLNLFAMLREGLRSDVSVAFRKAITNKEPVFLPGVRMGKDGEAQTINVQVTWVSQPESLRGTVLIIFTDVPEIKDLKRQVSKGKKTLTGTRQTELEEELQHTRQEVQDTLEEMQTSQEELKSANEELQSTNEELQSTNEELTTSKEEMQSLNEELQTVNAELQSKVDDLSRLNNDMKNLLNSTDIATLFLDKELNIRRYTNQATHLFKLIKTDVGRPFTDLASHLEYPGLASDALAVLRTLVFIQKQIPTKDGRWFSIRIMPYRTLDDRIEGLVITFIDISSLIQVEARLHEKEQIHRLLLNSSQDIIIELSAGMNIQEFNPGAELFFGRKRDEVINQSFIQLFVPEPAQRKTEKDLNNQLKNVPHGKLRIQVLMSGRKLTSVEWSANVVFNNLNAASGIIMITKKV